MAVVLCVSNLCGEGVRVFLPQRLLPPVQTTLVVHPRLLPLVQLLVHHTQTVHHLLVKERAEDKRSVIIINTDDHGGVMA